jgi:glycerol-3-phosphate dehydrogenase
MITRDPGAAARKEFDLVIVGGGIYGVSLLQEASRCGLSACLVEASDFGAGTSWNSLRIVHGGLRYLQTFDLRRFFQSVAARRQVAMRFPSLVRPLKCAMPLYGRGMKRSSVMRLALGVNDLLSVTRNRRLHPGARLSAGRLMDAREARSSLPGIHVDGLQGAAVWRDYAFVSSERILIELLHDACRAGASALNYAEATGILGEGGSASGVRVQDRLTGKGFDIAARTVVNCCGPRVRQLAHGRGGDAESLFHPSLAFNLLLDIDLGTDFALAVAAPRPSAPVFFLVPQSGSVLAGTRHLPRSRDSIEAVPSVHEVEEFLRQLNEALPGLRAGSESVRQIFAGLLPASAAGETDLLKRERILDHGAAGGLKNFYSVSGVKYTTAGAVACELLQRMGHRLSQSQGTVEISTSPATGLLTDSHVARRMEKASLSSYLSRVVEEESVHCLDDLILRRTNWAVAQPDCCDLRTLAGRLLELPDRLPVADLTAGR